jgi:hypothetical protein
VQPARAETIETVKQIETGAAVVAASASAHHEIDRDPASHRPTTFATPS